MGESMNKKSEITSNSFLENLENICLSNKYYAEKFFTSLMNSITKDGITSTSINQSVKNDEVENDSIIIYTNKLIEIQYKLNPSKFIEELNTKKYTIPDIPYIELSIIIKLLQIILVRIVFFIPGAGIKNTNHENLILNTNGKTYNYRASMITVYNLYKLLTLLLQLLPYSSLESFWIPLELNNLISAIKKLLKENDTFLISDQRNPESENLRKSILVKNLDYFSIYKINIENSIKTTEFYTSISKLDLTDTLNLFLLFLEKTIKSNKRKDGLFNSYNTIKISDNSISILNLPATIEGQAAVISSGFLSPSEVIQILDSIKSSTLYSQSEHIFNAVEDYIPKINNHVELQKFLYIYKKQNINSSKLLIQNKEIEIKNEYL